MSPTWEDTAPDPGPPSMRFAMPPVTPVVKKLLIVNTAIWVFFFLFDTFAPSAARPVLDTLALNPEQWKAWFPFVPIWQIVTAGFLHAILDPMHLIGNMIMLYFLGTMLEGIIGSRRFLVTYAAALLAGSFLGITLRLITGDDASSVGASGAVLGIVFAVAVLRPNVQLLFFLFTLPLWLFATVYGALQVLFGLRDLVRPEGLGVDFYAHLGGMAYGFLAARKGWLWRDPIEKVERKKAQRDAQKSVDEQKKLDALLERIHREGINSLSKAEKAFLKRVSKRS